MSRFSRALLVAGLWVGMTGCAGATIGSGVGDRLLSHPPHYAGASGPGQAEAVGHVPLEYRTPEGEPASFGPGQGSDGPLAGLLGEMNAYLAELGLTVPIQATGPVPGTPPDVLFGCDPDPFGDCAGPEDGHIDRDSPRMRLAVARPSSDWTAWFASGLEDAGAASGLLLTLETADYWVRQKNWRGQKEVELGTGYSVDVPWLTSLDDPVSVLQLTGALIGPDGKAIRIGAEGLIARRTPLLLSAVGVQALITDDDVEALRTARREDLPGRPLVWQVALRTLVAELTGSIHAYSH